MLGLPLIIIFLVIITLSITVIVKIFHNRKNISCMTGMMIAMTNGMNTGLVLGVIFGILLSGNLFLTSVLGMILGLVTGFLTGMPVSMIAVLDGLLSGVMGGLMGAMFGEMIALKYQDSVVKIMFLLYFASMLIVINIFHREINKDENTYLNNPIILAILFGVIFIVFERLGPIFS